MALCSLRFFYSSLLLFLTSLTLVSAATVTIAGYPGVASQRACVQQCLTFYPGDKVGCGTPLDNSCFCRSDLIPVGASAFSKCASSACNGNDVDISAATSIYLGYCSSNGYVAATTTAAGNGASAQVVTTIQGVATTVQVAATATQASSNSGNSGNSGGCGNGLTNVSGSVNCGTTGKSDASSGGLDQRTLTIAVGGAVGALAVLAAGVLL